MVFGRGFLCLGRVLCIEEGVRMHRKMAKEAK